MKTKIPAIPKIDRALARKVLKVVDAGLVQGQGQPEPGHMCVEAAVCFALGLPHSDDPPCVSHAVRSFKIALNDSSWSSDKARTKGLRRLAIAQLGSDVINDQIFVKEMALAAVRLMVPIALRAAASIHPDKNHKDALLLEAGKCESVTSFDQVKPAARAAARAAADAAAYAAYAADAAADAAAYAAYAADADKKKDDVLSIMAEAGVQALIKCESPGCKWLDLCDE